MLFKLFLSSFNLFINIFYNNISYHLRQIAINILIKDTGYDLELTIYYSYKDRYNRQLIPITVDFSLCYDENNDLHNNIWYQI